MTTPGKRFAAELLGATVPVVSVADLDRTIADLRGEVAMLRAALGAKVTDAAIAEVDALLAPLRDFLDPPGTFSTSAMFRPRTPAEIVDEVVAAADRARIDGDAANKRAVEIGRKLDAAFAKIGRLTMEIAALETERDR